MASVVVNYRRDKEGAESLQSEIEASGGQAALCQADVSDPAAAARLVDFAFNRFGRLDILVNNAGAMGRTAFLQTSQEEFDQLINVNLRGTWNCSQVAAAHMVEARYGRILNLSSLAAAMPSAGHAAYAASKAALFALTRVMAGELAPYNILVNACVPGTFETSMSRPAIEQRGREMLSTIGLRRFGQPSEIAALAAFLVSPINSYMSGSIIYVDGAKFAVQDPTKPWRDAGLIE